MDLLRQIRQLKAEVATYRPVSHLPSSDQAYQARVELLAALYDRWHATLQP